MAAVQPPAETSSSTPAYPTSSEFRNAPPYSFSIAPTLIRSTFYDYFPSGYNVHALSVLPENIPGAYVGAYHANRVLFSSYHNGLAMGKLGLFYLDDFTWGPQTLDSEAQQYDGGNLMFAELKIQFPNPGTGEHILNLNVYDQSYPKLSRKNPKISF